MTFIEAVRSCLSQYAGFQGRAPRSEFWWFWVFTLLMEIAAFVIGTMLLAGSITATQVSGGQIDAWYFFAGPNWLSTVVHLGLILPSLSNPYFGELATAIERECTRAGRTRQRRCSTIAH